MATRRRHKVCQVNHGLNWQKELKDQSKKDWVFGAASLVCIAEGIPSMERESYLPKGEVQHLGSEKMDCTTRSALNILETKFNFLIRE